jgi:hypothetical protein
MGCFSKINSAEFFNNKIPQPVSILLTGNTRDSEISKHMFFLKAFI